MLALTQIEVAGIFTDVMLIVFGLWFGAWGVVEIIRMRQQAKRDRDRAAGSRCDRCGKPVASGAEEYHRKRCPGRPRGQENLRWKGGGHVER